MGPGETDALLSRFLGDSLQAATIRLVGGALALAAVVGLLVYLIH